MSNCDVKYAIIGGGVIGRAIAYALRSAGEHDVAVIERCRHDAIENQSTRNSGVIHAGIYYKQEVRPNKAHMCVEGNRLLYDFCEEFGVNHARTGKLVVATCSREEDYLRDIEATARSNGVPGLRLLNADEQREMEPNIASSQSLYVPSSGVIDAVDYLQALRRCGQSHNLFDSRVVNISRVRDGFQVSMIASGKKESFVAERVINAAGLYADEIARMINPASPHQIMAVRGEAAKFYSTRRPELGVGRMNIYPVPHGCYKANGAPAEVSFQEFKELLREGLVFDTLGVHITPTLTADGEVSSTVTLCPAVRTGVGREDFGNDLYPPDYYWERVKSFFPGLRPTDVELHQTGIQARLLGRLDWVIEPDENEPNFINLIGIDSPGLTASLSIAKFVVDELLQA